jgi:hypothetical protein
VVDVHPCLSDGTFYVSLEFGHENTGGVFRVKGNGVTYGYFSYDDLPVSIGPLVGNGTTPYEFVVQDLNHPDCSDGVEIGTVSCATSGDCEIFDLIADPGICHNDGTYNLWLNFEFNNATNNYFDVFYNGDVLDYFPLSNLPVVIPHFHDDGETAQSITVCINDNPNCCATTEFEAPDCNTPNLVWPGDTNADGVADEFDLLNLGLAFNAGGPQRPVQGIEWVGLEAENWTQLFGSNLNFKYADCNGNGLVNTADMEALAVNFGETHGAPQAPVLIGGTENDPPFFVDLPGSGDLISGQPFTAPIMLGSADKPVQNAYGIAFTLHFDPDIVDPASVQLAYDPNWLGVNGVNLLTFDKTFAEEGIIHVALVRTDGNNVSGFGQIAAFIGIIDNIAGKDNMSIKLTGVRAIRENEALIPLHRPVETVALTTGVNTPVQDNKINVYPNPAEDVVFIEHADNLPLEMLEIEDVNGQVLRSEKFNSPQLNLAGLAPGVYFLKIKSGDRLFIERLAKL